MGRSGWKPAQATVKASRDSSKFAIAGGSGSGLSNGPTRHDYVVEIVPSCGDAPFSTTMTTPMFAGHWRTLHAGNIVTVLHKPGTEEVKWDRKEKSTSRRWARKAAQTYLKHAGDRQFNAALNASGQKHGHDQLDAKTRELIEFEERAQAEEDRGRGW